MRFIKSINRFALRPGNPAVKKNEIIFRYKFGLHTICSGTIFLNASLGEAQLIKMFSSTLNERLETALTPLNFLVTILMVVIFDGVSILITIIT
jgi:hypothetical protein